MTLKSKVTSLGLIELKDEGGRYTLYVAGVLRESSADLNYVLSRFESY